MTRQLPQKGEIFLDHVAHFVPDLARASTFFERIGFRLTPFTEQRNRTPEGLVSAGMANRCAMLREGYLELLTAVGDTELAGQFHAATDRYVGLHLIAFSLADPQAAHATLVTEGFKPRAPVTLTRPVEDPQGETREARFTVLRVPPEAMPEGRVQVLQHHTEELVWQERRLTHDNGVVSLKGVLLVVADPEETARRFGRFVGRAPRRRDARWLLDLDRGACVFVAPEDLDSVAPGVGVAPSAARPSPPVIVATALGSSDTELTRDRFQAGGLEATMPAPGEALYRFPPELGGSASVVPLEASVSWLS
ncbi:VOC family protein [Algihabitans albus]|uniref:VOC family protein n=1 Tax=Algihabitans albus TaxID=2164067 RepID=UPI0013C366A5|nr:VOC family protein [Algihabitans albus]